jgi:predicted RNase H-like HicB family nuclease
MAINKMLTIADADGWVEHHGDVFRCPVYLHPRDGGGFTATVAVLSGVNASGTTEAEVLLRVTEALESAIAVHKSATGTVPWINTPLKPATGTVVRWVFPHVSV